MWAKLTYLVLLTFLTSNAEVEAASRGKKGKLRMEEMK